MTEIDLTLTLLPDTFSICRLVADSEIPSWATAGDFFSITGTADELSVVCLQEHVPTGIRCEKDYSCLRVEGPLDFGLTGILVSLTKPLAHAGISVLPVSTFDTDYLLVKEDRTAEAIEVLSEAGHRVLK